MNDKDVRADKGLEKTGAALAAGADKRSEADVEGEADLRVDSDLENVLGAATDDGLAG